MIDDCVEQLDDLESDGECSDCEKRDKGGVC